MLRALPSDPAARKGLVERLICPTEDWGPGLADNFRKYSESHGKGLKLDEGDDDVFGEKHELTGRWVSGSLAVGLLLCYNKELSF